MTEKSDVQEQEAQAEEPREESQGEKTLHVKTISVTYSRKFNLDHYESMDVGVTMWADRPESADIGADFDALWELAKEQVKAQSLPVLRQRDERRKRQQGAIDKAAAEIKAIADSMPAPPPAPSSSVPPTPPTSSTASNEEAIDTVKITAPSGKAVVEFWRAGRKYPELKWALGGEALLKIAPTLTAAGWTAEHFEAIGQEYALSLKVYWVVSPKNPKWKDITRVELV